MCRQHHHDFDAPDHPEAEPLTAPDAPPWARAPRRPRVAAVVAAIAAGAALAASAVPRFGVEA